MFSLYSARSSAADSSRVTQADSEILCFLRIPDASRPDSTARAIFPHPSAHSRSTDDLAAAEFEVDSAAVDMVAASSRLLILLLLLLRACSTTSLGLRLLQILLGRSSLMKRVMTGSGQDR